jgi:hypothetical protein
MTGSLVIVSRFCGPPDSGNGGYVCGLIAGYLDGPAEVTLRQPPPLETTLTLEHDADGSIRVRDGQTLIAEATSSLNAPALQLPDPVSVQQARSAGARSHLRLHPGQHPFPTCFVCGPDRRPGDGLRIMVGPVAGRELSADLWYPAADLTSANGHVRPEFIWAALDCAGGIGAIGDAIMGRAIPAGSSVGSPDRRGQGRPASCRDWMATSSGGPQDARRLRTVRSIRTATRGGAGHLDPYRMT